MVDPYQPPATSAENTVSAGEASLGLEQLATIAAVYGAAGLVIASPVVAAIAFDAVVQGLPADSTIPRRFWFTATGASALVPPLLYRLTAPTWTTARGQALLGMLSVVVVSSLSFGAVAPMLRWLADHPAPVGMGCLGGALVGLVASPLGVLPGRLIRGPGH